MLLFRLILILVCISYGQECFAQDYIQVPAAIQIASQVSDGQYTIRGIVSAAKENGIRALIIADRDYMRWEYGIWPLRNVLKKTVEHNSIAKYGIERYFKQFREIERENPDMIMLLGIESAPFYYWQGSVFQDNLIMKNWHKHMLAVGIENPGVLKNLPTVGNKKALALPVTPRNLFLFWPVLLLAAGILVFRKRLYNYKDSFGKKLGPFSKSWQAIGIVLVTISMLFLTNNYPFVYYLFDQYHGDQGIKPYQNFIDYIDKQSGLTYWLHPEAENILQIETVAIETKQYSQDLLQAHNYTGFAVFHQGYEKVGLPEGIWDKILNQYCQGKRSQPVWAIATLAFDATGNLEQELKNLRTVLLLRDLSKEELYNSLKNGRAYVVKGRDCGQFFLDDFSIKDSDSDQKKIMGEQLFLKGKPEIRIKGNIWNGQDRVFKIQLIKNGMAIKRFDAPAVFDITYQDPEPTDSSYYRLELESKDLKVITNPIFVKKVK